jgi:hypothetical protein
MSPVEAELMSNEKTKKPTKTQTVEDVYKKPWVREALTAIVAEGKAALTKTPKSTKENVDTLVTALLRAMQEPGCEIRLTYKTTAEATCAWTWMVAACKGKGLIDHDACSAFDVELVNGSGVMFWTDEGKPGTKEKDG